MVSNVISWDGQAHQSQGEPRLLGYHDSLLKRARDRALMGYKGQPRHRLYFSTAETTTSTTPCSELYSVILAETGCSVQPCVFGKRQSCTESERAGATCSMEAPMALNTLDVFFPEHPSASHASPGLTRWPPRGSTGRRRYASCAWQHLAVTEPVKPRRPRFCQRLNIG